MMLVVFVVLRVMIMMATRMIPVFVLSFTGVIVSRRRGGFGKIFFRFGPKLLRAMAAAKMVGAAAELKRYGSGFRINLHAADGIFDVGWMIHNASIPFVPVRMLMASAISEIKMRPSPCSPV